SDLVAEDIVRREAYREQIRGGSATELFVQNQLLRELELILIRKWSRADDVIEPGGAPVLTLPRSSRSQRITVTVFPLAVPIFFGALAFVELLRPVWQRFAIESGSDPHAALAVDPIGAVARKSGGQNGRAILQREGEHTRLATRGEL